MIIPANAPPRADSLKASYKTAKATLLELFQSAPNVDGLMHALARATDEALRGAWEACAMPKSAALIAVGGYGRGELAPYSDVDILVLLPDDDTPDHTASLAARIERLIGMAWDLGLEIGSSVRSVTQCIDEASNDITIQTSLLEARRIVGNEKLFEMFEKRYRQTLDPRAFFQAKVLEMRQRHAKYQDTPYSLEPNIKESPGGLRDLQLILWISHAVGFGSSWRELDSRGLITEREASKLRRNEGFLKTLRARLHVIARRRQDILVFDLQTALAESLGYKATSSKRASEQLMRRYYWTAKTVTQLATILIQNVEAQLFPSTSSITRVLNEHFVEKQGMLEIASHDVFEREPNAILEAFLLYEQTRGVKGLSARTLRAIYNARDLMGLDWRCDPENRCLFMEILKQPEGITHALRLMNQTSVLGRYPLPAQLPAHCRPDAARPVSRLYRRSAHPDGVAQYPALCDGRTRARIPRLQPVDGQFRAPFERPWVLYIVALFHDIAKGRGGDHSVLGMADARRFCRDHDVGADDSDLVVWLVEQHLTMSQVAQKQDTSDPEVIEQFASMVKTERWLTALYLLTVADIRGTSPKVWNAWKGKLLEDLYRATRAVLGGAELHAHSELKSRQEDALALLRLETVPENAEKALWDKLDVGYFLRHDAADIAWQTRVLYKHVESENPIVRARPSLIGAALQVLVYVQDRPDLFAEICAYFDKNGLSVLDARVTTTRHGYALDNFLVAHPDHDGHYRDIANLVEQQLSMLLSAEGILPEPSKGRVSRLVRTFPITPRVDLRPDERGQYYILSVSANDRQGLLYLIARVLAQHRIGVHAARINTLGERVEDVFLLDGKTLSDNRTQIQVKTELLRVIAA